MSLNVMSILPTLTDAPGVHLVIRSEVKLNKGGTRGYPVNSMYGRVHKLTRVTGSVFSDSGLLRDTVSLTKVIKGEEKWIPKERKWGERVNDGPVIAHLKDGKVHYYLEYMMTAENESTYYLDQKEIDKEAITGMPVKKKGLQAENGIGDTRLRCVSLENIQSIQALQDGLPPRSFLGPFHFLMPCPMCGDTAAEVDMIDSIEIIDITFRQNIPLSPADYAVHCTQKECQVIGPRCRTRDEAIQAWNHR